MVIRKWGGGFWTALAGVWSKEAPSESVDLPAASAELLELLKRTPGESGSSKREFAAMTSAAD
jgi:hypothetical protein